MKYRIDYSWLHCSNKELVKELEEKEDFFAQIAERIMRCPHCKKGHFFLERDDREYSSDAWWMCDNCLECDGTPSKLREKMIEEIALYGIDEYWDYAIYEYIQKFEYEQPRTYREDEPKKREFNAEEWDKEEHYTIFDCEQTQGLKWEEFVEKEIRGHIACLDKAIERAKKYKMLKHFLRRIKMTDKERIKELERTIEELRVIIADQSATNQNDWVEYQYKLRDNTYEICKKIRKLEQACHVGKPSGNGYRGVFDREKFLSGLSQIEKEGEEKCVKTIQRIE